MILNANIFRIPEIINSPKMSQFKSEHFDEVISLYKDLELEDWKGPGISKLSMGNTGLSQDRTGTLKHYLKVSDHEPLPDFDPNFKKSFKDITFETVQRIIDNANGQRINISWSGGLDSTNMLFTFLEIADPKQLRVCCNYNSIVESANLYDKFIRNRVECEITLPVAVPYYGDGVIVTGYHGDAIFPHYNKIIQNYGDDGFNLPWRDFLEKEQVPIIEQVIETYPIKDIQSIVDYLSFIEINFKWQWSKTHKMRQMPKEIASRIVNFYDTVDFQKWSMNNYEEKYLTADRKTWKQPIRNNLRKLMGGANYYTENKLIQQSNYQIIDHNWVFLLEDGTNLYKKDFI
jgi:hypothetical protein